MDEYSERARGRGDLRRIMQALHDPSFEVKDLSTQDVVKGITPLKYVHHIMDIKAMTNTSDIAMDMIIKYYGTQVLTWSHNLPTSFYKVQKLLRPRDPTLFQYWQCTCGEHAWACLPDGLVPDTYDTSKSSEEQGSVGTAQ